MAATQPTQVMLLGPTDNAVCLICHVYFYFTAIKFFFDRWYFTAIKLSANLSKKVNDKKKAKEELTELEYQTNEDVSVTKGSK